MKTLTIQKAVLALSTKCHQPATSSSKELQQRAVAKCKLSRKTNSKCTLTLAQMWSAKYLRSKHGSIPYTKPSSHGWDPCTRLKTVSAKPCLTQLLSGVNPLCAPFRNLSTPVLRCKVKTQLDSTHSSNILPRSVLQRLRTIERRYSIAQILITATFTVYSWLTTSQ